MSACKSAVAHTGVKSTDVSELELGLMSGSLQGVSASAHFTACVTWR